MSLPSEFSITQCSATVCIFIGVLLHIIGLATPSWTTATFKYQNPQQQMYYAVDVTVGLWENCGRSGCSAIESYNLSGSWRAAGGFAILGMLSSVITLAVAIFHIASPFCKKLQYEFMTLIILAGSIITIVWIIIGVSCYGGGVHKSFDWPYKSIGYSLILSMLGGIVVFIGGVLFHLRSFRK